MAPADAAVAPRHTPSAARWIAFAALSAATVLLMFWAYVPLNMDEYVSYQTLAALSHPNAGENIFCSTKPSFYLDVLGRFRLPLLTYDYIGSLSSLLYTPFFLIWRDPMSARLTGILTLLLQAVLVARIFRFRTAAVFCCLLFFLPYSFVHIADTGPVAFQTTSVFLVCALLRAWILSRRPGRRYALMAAAGLAISLACWVKPTYFFPSFGLAATALAAFLLAWTRRRKERGSRLGEYAVLFLCAAIPTALIYEAKHPTGGAYLPVISGNFVPGQVLLANLGTRFRENVLHLLLNPLDAASLHFDLLPRLPAWTVLACLLAGFLLLRGLFLRRLPRRHRWEILLNLAGFAVGLLLVATNEYAKSMHHVVLAYPFAILAVARGLAGPERSRRLPRLALAAFVALHGLMLFRLPGLMDDAVQRSSSKAFVAQLHDELDRREADNTVIACVDWGIYFVQALYGPRTQVVLFLCDPDNAVQLDQAAGIARRLHRDLAVVGLDGNRATADRLAAAVPAIRERRAAGAGNPWRIWRVPYAQLADLPTQAFARAVVVP
jgi:hypothetical protein